MECPFSGTIITFTQTHNTFKYLSKPGGLKILPFDSIFSSLYRTSDLRVSLSDPLSLEVEVELARSQPLEPELLSLSLELEVELPLRADNCLDRSLSLYPFMMN